MAALGDKASEMANELRLGTKYDYQPDKKCDGSENKEEWIASYIKKVGGDGNNLYVDLA